MGSVPRSARPVPRNQPELIIVGKTPCPPVAEIREICDKNPSGERCSAMKARKLPTVNVTPTFALMEHAGTRGVPGSPSGKLFRFNADSSKDILPTPNQCWATVTRPALRDFLQTDNFTRESTPDCPRPRRLDSKACFFQLLPGKFLNDLSIERLEPSGWLVGLPPCNAIP